MRISRDDVIGAVGVFLFVFLSTFPVVIPFVVMRETGPALRTSNAVAIVMLFATGFSVGKHAGRSGWRTGLGMVLVGIIVVAITMARGG